MYAGTILPVPVGSAATGWELVDPGATPSYDSRPAAGGVATLTADQLPPDELWLIDRAVISCTSATPTQLRLYVETVDPRQLRDGSDRGNFDVAEYPGGLVVRPSTSLVAVWTGASDGAVGTLALQARQLRRRGRG